MSGKLKEVRERIKSVQSTQQITKAMKMVSASKLRRAQQAITEMRPYANRLDKMMKNIVSNLDGDFNSPYIAVREPKKVAIIVITSNRGLCGAFNTNIIKVAAALAEETYANQLAEGNVTFVFVGKKGYDVLKKRFPNSRMITSYVDLFADLSYDNISSVSQMVMDNFQAGELDKVEVCYGQFRNAAVQEPLAVQFLPVKSENSLDPSVNTAAKTSKADYIFEPDKEQLLSELIPSILHTSFQKFVLDNHASEHGARMTAMDNATTNAEELMKELKINYNKARQEAITKELSEIVGGAAALNG
ncbi:MAG TPA: ATP synthase F1 subunit gamma [Saprospiraceae bacterium]|jgi:F-type H+-transporting ATPase subunit gamma|nr:ATP synthase F1 subunit gamma [Saprospiraceae bacterium]HRO09035.1 ATP synthase F1 subunit gamma [Saprospiraceae bacterium]HRO73940.1 ATP synthase F1 subunit gamma [Saprospiraceae bacterium]HRP42382.1 ATP synthase F1 subunit gamma [Saprospiraceae bacterium]